MKKNTLGSQFDTIVHIGAGRGSELDTHLSLGARRIVLVDADQIVVARLQRLAGVAVQADVAIEVIEAAVAGEEKDAELHIYNLERVSGIRKPEALTEIYPGLRVVRSTSLRTQEAARLIEDLKINPDKENSLIIDAPGEEYAIVANLRDKDALDLFSVVSVPVSRRPLYLKAAGANDVAKLLQGAGYYVHFDGDEERPTLSAILLRLRRDIDDIKHFELKASELAKENASLTDEVAKLKKLEGDAIDFADRKLMFESELRRCESQVDLLKDLLRDGYKH